MTVVVFPFSNSMPAGAAERYLRLAMDDLATERLVDTRIMVRRRTSFLGGQYLVSTRFYDFYVTLRP